MRSALKNPVRITAGALLALWLVTCAPAAVLGQSQPSSSSLQTLTAEEIVQKLMVANERRATALRALQATRAYDVAYKGLWGDRSASMKVDATYTAPDTRNFDVISENGSKFLIHHVLQKLLSSEKDAHEGSDKNIRLSPENYDFSFVNDDRTGYGDAYVLELKPRTSNKYLYKGKIWVDANDFAVVKIEAEPAKNPSFWITHTDIEQRYAKFGNFWLPVHNHTVSHIRLGGEATLNITYGEYHLNGSKEAVNATQTNLADVPPAAVTADPR